MKVKVLSMRCLTGAGNLRAFASIQIGPLIIHDFRVIQQGELRAYVSPPQSTYEVEGRKRYKPLLEYPEEWKDAIQDTLLKAWQEDLQADLDREEMFSKNISPCCKAAVNQSRVIQAGRHKGHGPRFCSKCSKFLYQV